MKSLYDVLGVPRAAPAPAIRAAYHRRARDLHPDAHPHAPAWVRIEKEQAMAALNHAYDVLADPGRRRAYDADLAAGRASAPPAPRAPVRRAWRRGEIERRLGAGFHHIGAGAWIERPRVRLPLILETVTADLAPLRMLDPGELDGLFALRVPITDDAVEHLRRMTALADLTVISGRLTDRAGSVLGELPLRSVNLYGNPLGDGAVAGLVRARRLRDVNLGATRVTDACIPSLASLRQLSTLVLRGTKVTADGLVGLRALDRLRLLAPPRLPLRQRRRVREALPRCMLV